VPSVAGLLAVVSTTRGACPPPPRLNDCAERRETQVHWTYKVLRRIAYVSLAVSFWAWVIALALSGRI